MGANNFALVGEADTMEQAAGATQTSGASGEATARKEFALAELREDLWAVNRTARALAVDESAIGALFRMPHGNNEQNLPAARAFLTDAAPLKHQFIAFGSPIDLRRFVSRHRRL